MKKTLTALVGSALLALSLSPEATAQRTSAPITQGVTSADLAATVDRLRSSNAELQTEIAQMRADKAQMTGRIETLEFLLSETNDELNRLNVDTIEIGRVIEDYDKKIAELEARLAAVESRSASGSFASLEDGEVTIDEQGRRVVRRVITPTTPTDGEAGAADTGAPTTSDLIADGTDVADDRGGFDDSAGVPAGAPQSSLGTIPASALPGEAGPLFAEAKSRLLRFDYAGAELAFTAFLAEFGSDPQAGEAQYWLGEVLYQQGQYAESGAAFTQMLRTYPDDIRAPEALVKLARSLRLIGETDKACTALATLPRRYPDASDVTKNFANVERVRSACPE